MDKSSANFLDYYLSLESAVRQKREATGILDSDREKGTLQRSSMLPSHAVIVFMARARGILRWKTYLPESKAS